MIFFFGLRATKIKERRLNRTTCPHCSTKDSFTVSTFSKYFHFFWIPIIPLFKTNVAECSHCRKTFSANEFTPDMRRSLEVENRTNPAKRPIWQGCGCLILVVLFVIGFSISLYGVYLGSAGQSASEENLDSRKELLKADMDELTKLLHREKDSLSFALKSCIDDDIVSGLATEDIAYFTKINDNKVLVLLHIESIGDIRARERKVVLDVVEDCLFAMEGLNTIDEVYIGIEGKWNTVLVKTPTDEDVGGRFADKYKLLPFYGPKEIAPDTLDIKTDTIQKK